VEHTHSNQQPWSSGGLWQPAGQPGYCFQPHRILLGQAARDSAYSPIGDDKQSWAWGINAHGQVVGQSFNLNTGAARAFLYQKEQLTDLNTLIQPNSPLQLLLANDINDEGEIVGFANDTNTGTTVAFIAVPISGGNQAILSRTENDFRNKIVPESGRRPLAGTAANAERSR
jgi:probable HAF family extracellular repeat protein